MARTRFFEEARNEFSELSDNSRSAFLSGTGIVGSCVGSFTAEVTCVSLTASKTTGYGAACVIGSGFGTLTGIGTCVATALCCLGFYRGRRVIGEALGTGPEILTMC